MNQTCFQNVEEWSETNITGNNSFQWYFLTLSQVNWAGKENDFEFLSKEMPDIKIDDNCLFEVERRLNVYLNSNKFEQLENQHTEKMRENTLEWSEAPTSLPPTSREDLRLDGYLEYPHVTQALYIYKHSRLLRDSNPVLMA
ncbi:hypothetical protein TNCV_1069921 [Trichonephila clavipes]|nr:hypothetical protein TNCV_1069921 [Trichonephila clavipes]